MYFNNDGGPALSGIFRTAWLLVNALSLGECRPVACIFLEVGQEKLSESARVKYSFNEVGLHNWSTELQHSHQTPRVLLVVHI